MAEKRFLALSDVGEVLNISSSQIYAIVRSGELPWPSLGTPSAALSIRHGEAHSPATRQGP